MLELEKCLFESKDRLPDPKGSLSSRLPSQAIALALSEVVVTTSEKGKTEARLIHLDHGPARFQAIELRCPDCGVDDKRSVPLGRRFFLSRVKKC